MEMILELSLEKNAFTMGFLWPEKVKGRKPSILCKLISFMVRSELVVRKKRESWDQEIWVILSVCKFPYFL